MYLVRILGQFLVWPMFYLKQLMQGFMVYTAAPHQGGSTFTELSDLL